MSLKRLHVSLLAALALTTAMQSTAQAGLFDSETGVSIESLRNYHPKMPLRVLTSDGAVIGEFGDEHRVPVKIGQVPQQMKLAILAAEDDRFYQHGGVDFIGVARAAVADVLSGGKRQGASTITMQVVRNFFLSKEKTFSRKINEMMLAMEVEKHYTKDQILELYMNQIYLGQRSYGFEAAAETYFGKHLNQLNLAEMAVLAGLPKGPSLYNPIANLPRAKERQQWILGRMRSLNYITEAQYRQALATPLHVKRGSAVDVNADHVAEMVRQQMLAKYGPSIYTSGMAVYTTLRKADQAAADKAVSDGTVAYDRRHGYRGPEGYFTLPAGFNPVSFDNRLSGIPTVGELQPALVLSASSKRVDAYIGGGQTVHITGAGLTFVRKHLSSKASNPIRRGALIRVLREGRGWAIAEVPQVQAAFIALDPVTGAVRAMVGGVDFAHDKVDHVTQAWRQPGSSFKPFLYSAALEKGYTAASVFDDSPLSLPNGSGGVWEPKNYEGDYGPPMRLREALAHSRNLPTIRMLQAITPQYAQEYIQRFGFTPDKQPAYLTMALGAGSVTPLLMAQAYASFANGGFQVPANFIDKVVDGQGRVLAQWRPVPASQGKRIVDARNAFITTSMMQGVVQFGTGAAVAKLGRHDLAGKTGTTNDQTDGWFVGFNPNLVAVTWMGFDKPQPMGRGETGANTALPVWMEYMGRMLKNVPDRPWTPPPGVVTAQIDKVTGQVMDNPPNPMTEYFYADNIPGRNARSWAPGVVPMYTPPPGQAEPAQSQPAPAVPAPSAAPQPQAPAANGAKPFNWLPADPSQR